MTSLKMHGSWTSWWLTSRHPPSFWTPGYPRVVFSALFILFTQDCRAILPSHAVVKSADRISGNNERHYEEEVQQHVR